MNKQPTKKENPMPAKKPAPTTIGQRLKDLQQTLVNHQDRTDDFERLATKAINENADSIRNLNINLEAVQSTLDAVAKRLTEIEAAVGFGLERLNAHTKASEDISSLSEINIRLGLHIQLINRLVDQITILEANSDECQKTQLSMLRFSERATARILALEGKPPMAKPAGLRLNTKVRLTMSGSCLDPNRTTDVGIVSGYFGAEREHCYVTWADGSVLGYPAAALEEAK
jgi:hypothetical protein